MPPLELTQGGLLQVAVCMLSPPAGRPWEVTVPGAARPRDLAVFKGRLLRFYGTTCIVRYTRFRKNLQYTHTSMSGMSNELKLEKEKL